MEYCNNLLIFEGVLFQRKLRLLIIEVALLGLRINVPWQFNGHSLFPFGLERLCMSLRPLLFIPHLPLGVDGSNFLDDFSAISACSTSSFQVWALTAPIRISTWSRKLCLHICKSMGNASCWAHQRQVFEPLNVVSDRFALSLYGREEFVHGYFSIILVETRKKSSF